MANPVERWGAIDKSDRSFIVGSIVAPLVIWWFYYGRQKYGSKGMK